MVVFLLLLSLLVVPVSAADVYDVSDDAVPVPFAAAQWSTADSLHLQQIADRLNSSSGSAASLLSVISSKIGTNPNTIFYYLNSMDNRMSNIYNAMVGTGYLGGVSAGEGLFGHLRRIQTQYLSPISSNASATYTQVKAIADKMDSSSQSLRDLLIAPAGWEFVDHGGFRRVLDRPMSLIEFFDNFSLGMWERDSTPADWLWLSFTGEVGQIGRRVSTLEVLNNGILGLASRMQSYFQRPANRPGLLSDGSVSASYGFDWNLADLTADGFVGLAKRLSGDDRTTTFSFLPKDVAQAAVSVSVDNLLDAIGLVGTELQNPLQRLAFVFASDQDLSIRDDVSDNVNSAQDNFFKPGSGGSVSPDDIKDAAGFTQGAGGLLDTGASAGDVFAFVNQNYDFWSKATADDLDSTGSPELYSDEPPIYESWAMDEDGFYVLYDPSFVDNYLKKGG